MLLLRDLGRILEKSYIIAVLIITYMGHIQIV